VGEAILLKIESAGRVEKRTCSMEKIGDEAQERRTVGSGRTDGNAGEGPEITKTRLCGRGDAGF
jgi:hypothetical protein